MPVVSEWIDGLREQLGADMVDAQIAEGVKAQREYAEIERTHGTEAADLWRTQNAHRCTFFAEEGGRRVGLATPYTQGVVPEISQAEIRAAAAALVKTHSRRS